MRNNKSWTTNAFTMKKQTRFGGVEDTEETKSENHVKYITSSITCLNELALKFKNAN